MKGLLVCLLLVNLIFVVYAWGPEGHIVVASIAMNNLKTSTTQAIQKYLPTGQNLPDIANLADTYRSTTDGKWSAILHYVDLFRNQTAYNAALDCAQGCVVSAIANYTSILEQTGYKYKMLPASNTFRLPVEMQGITLPDIAEPNALEFLVHFVGDVHQPLHVGYGDDEGGNTVTVTFYTTKTNLHAVWDSGIITRYNSNATSFTEELLGMIQANSTLNDFTKQTDVVTWANESFDEVRSPDGVYDFNSTATIPLLSDWYYTKNLPVIKLRLIAAGLRLAALLNKIFS